MPYALRIFYLLALLLAAWNSVDWIRRADGPPHPPTVIAGVVAGVAVTAGAVWYVRRFRRAWAAREQGRVFVLILAAVIAILAFASTCSLLTGYTGSGGGASDWPPVLRGGGFGRSYFHFAATVYTGLALIVLGSLLRRARPRQAGRADT